MLFLVEIFSGNVILRNFVRSHFTLVWVRGVLHSVHYFRFVGLPFFEKLFDALRIHMHFSTDSLRVTRLAAGSRAQSARLVGNQFPFCRSAPHFSPHRFWCALRGHLFILGCLGFHRGFALRFLCRAGFPSPGLLLPFCLFLGHRSPFFLAQSLPPEARRIVFCLTSTNSRCKLPHCAL